MKNALSKPQLSRHVSKSVEGSVSNHEPERNRSGSSILQHFCSRSTTDTAITNNNSDIDISCPAQNDLNFLFAPTNPGRSSRKLPITKIVRNGYNSNPNATTFDILDLAQPYVESLLAHDSPEFHDRRYQQSLGLTNERAEDTVNFVGYLIKISRAVWTKRGGYIIRSGASSNQRSPT